MGIKFHMLKFHKDLNLRVLIFAIFFQSRKKAKLKTRNIFSSSPFCTCHTDYVSVPGLLVKLVDVNKC